MFTWNFQYMSRSRLAETFKQLMLTGQTGSVLIRIHTSIHKKDDAVELARFIKGLMPDAKIFGTSTSAVINWGKLTQNQCVISITQMQEGRIETAMIPTLDENGDPIDTEDLCKKIKNDLIEEDTKLLLTFSTKKFLDIYNFVDKSNTYCPEVKMIGGLADTPENYYGFLFDETGAYEDAILMAAFSGSELETSVSYASGVEVVGNEEEITDCYGPCILSINDEKAVKRHKLVLEDVDSKFKNLFPFVYSDAPGIPFYMSYGKDKSIAELFPVEEDYIRKTLPKKGDLDIDKKDDYIYANHYVIPGKKLSRAFIYDRKIISDNRALFQTVENFEKAETLFGYTCVVRSQIYSNCVKWELSAYENCNICGCVTAGEITNCNGRNTFANCTFSLAVAGEEKGTQEYNPYAFARTDSLAEDNMDLLEYLMGIEGELASFEEESSVNSIRKFINDCEVKLLYADKEDVFNEAALIMDMKTKGYDRICYINVFNASDMKTVFSPREVQITRNSLINKCINYVRKRHYRLYILDEWLLAIGAPSHIVSLNSFVTHMEELQKILFETSKETIAIVPGFCVMDGCTIDNINSVYAAARIEMGQKNVQFYISDAENEKIDEEKIREYYRMVNVINYAIAHDQIIPYFQGIYDNETKSIHHYESLMRLKDETGRVYNPASFLDAARSFGLLYDNISMIMIKKVFEKFKNVKNKSVSINLGLRDIKNRKLVEFIYDFLRTAEHPENFVFEILENEDVDDYNALIKFVDTIHNLGGKISIDDFGSGYSNLQHIVNIHSDYLKIDGSIVRNCCDNKEAENLIALISGWKKVSSKNIKIVAEFVENEQIQDKLLFYAIDYSQGYLFSKPMPFTEDMIND